MTTLIQRRRVPVQGGMGDWREAVAELVAGDELSELVRGIRGVQDRLRGAIVARKPILDGYVQAKALAQEATRLFGPLMSQPIGLIPTVNLKVVPAAEALRTATKGVEYMAREVFTLTMLDRVFTEISAALTQAGLSTDADSVWSTVQMIRRFTLETDDTFFSLVPEYGKTKEKLLSSTQSQWAHVGVASNAVGDPRWIQAVMDVAEQVVPLPAAAGASEGIPEGTSMMSGMGALPLLAVVLLKVLAIVATTVVAIVAIRQLIPNQNSKAETARELLLRYQAQKENEAAQMRAMGKSEAEIQSRMEAIDREAGAAVEKIPEPRSILGTVGTVLAVAAAAAVGTKIAGVW